MRVSNFHLGWIEENCLKPLAWEQLRSNRCQLVIKKPMQSVGEPMVTKRKQNRQSHAPARKTNWGYPKGERQKTAIATRA
jgi:hypothetical protein